MKPLVILGVLIVLAGGYILLRGFSYTSDRSTVELGPFRASVEEKQVVPTWVGGLAVGLGLVMVVAGSKSRSR
ncbi:MAG TPA: hypothetical protein VE869_12425 [Gemmatimonas sp.]|nr:hypothetical protein [Gemmatimonas sp.]